MIKLRSGADESASAATRGQGGVQSTRDWHHQTWNLKWDKSLLSLDSIEPWWCHCCFSLFNPKYSEPTLDWGGGVNIGQLPEKPSKHRLLPSPALTFQRITEAAGQKWPRNGRSDLMTVIFSEYLRLKWYVIQDVIPEVCYTTFGGRKSVITV